MGVSVNDMLSTLAETGDESAARWVQEAIDAGIIENDDTYKAAWEAAAAKTFSAENLDEMTEEEAREALSMYKANGWANADNAKKYEDAVNKAFKPVGVEHKFTYDGDRDLSNVGKNFVIEDEYGGKYRVESNGEVTSKRIVGMANKLAAGTVFKSGEDLYVVMDVEGTKKVYKIKKRGNKDGYDDIMGFISDE